MLILSGGDGAPSRGAPATQPVQRSSHRPWHCVPVLTLLCISNIHRRGTPYLDTGRTPLSGAAPRGHGWGALQGEAGAGAQVLWLRGQVRWCSRCREAVRPLWLGAELGVWVTGLQITTAACRGSLVASAFIPALIAASPRNPIHLAVIDKRQLKSSCE